MYRKQIYLGLAIMSLVGAALACNFLVSTAKIENLRMARDEQGEQTTTAFGQQDNFYLLGDLKNAPSDTKLKAVWTGVEVKDNPPNTMIDEKELVTGDGNFTFSLLNNNPIWPAGKYKVDLYLNDKLDQTVDFTVEQTEQAATVQNLRLASDEQGSQLTSVFTPQDDFYLLGELSQATDQTRLKADWTAVDIEGYTPNSAIDSAELTTGDGPFTFSLKKTQPAWPAGKYKVDLYVNDKLTQTLDFTVEGQAATEPATAAPTEAAVQGTGAIENTRLARDQEGTDPTTVFNPQETFYLVSDLTGATDSGAQVKVVWTAVKLEGSTGENQVISTYDQNLPNGTFWVSLVSDSGKWPEGQYKAEVFVNGSSVDTRNFIVSLIQLKKIYMALDQDGKKPTTVYGTQDVFYLEFDLLNAPTDTKISTKWYRLDEKGSPAETLNEGEYTFGTGSYYVSLKSDSGTWLTGKYKVDLFMNNSYYKSVPFEVQ
jgi:hypothetical protein